MDGETCIGQRGALGCTAGAPATDGTAEPGAQPGAQPAAELDAQPAAQPAAQPEAAANVVEVEAETEAAAEGADLTLNLDGTDPSMSVIFQAVQQSRVSPLGLGVQQGASSPTPPLEVSVKLDGTMGTLGDILDAAVLNKLSNTCMSDFDGKGAPVKLAMAKEGEMASMAQTRPVLLSQIVRVTGKEPAAGQIPTSSLVLCVPVDATVLVEARQQACKLLVDNFLALTATRGMPLSRSTALPRLLGMNKSTCKHALTKKASGDCKQLIKIERFVKKHVDSDLKHLQAEIDAFTPTSTAEGDLTTTKKRKTRFNTAAAVFFEASYAAWGAAGHDRVELAKSMLKEAQCVERQEALGAESWTTDTITTKMGNMHKLKNAAGRKAAAAIQEAAPANA